MARELDKHAAVLRDTSAGWVYRRDAAEYLGKLIEKSAAALRANAKDNDVDVRNAVQRALGHASAALAGIKPVVDEEFSLDDLARACARPGRREVAQDGQGYVITVSLKAGRTQTVYLQPITRKDGARLVQVLTYCGAFDQTAMAWALKMNTQLGRCALGLAARDGNDHFVLVNCIPAGEATPELVKAVVKEIAFYGDWIEHKLTGKDEL